MAFKTCVYIATCCMSFILYGIGRTMSETIGFSARASASGILLVLILLLTPFTLVIFVLYCRNKITNPRVIILRLFMAALLGSILSEQHILADELRFTKEAVASGQSRYSRDRRWPNGTTSLLYSGERGFWAID